MRRQDVLKREVEVRYDYTVGAAYRSIDRHNDGAINMHNLGAFLRQCGHFAPEPELLSIIRRIDTDGDARLNFNEWTDFMRGAPPAAQCHSRPPVCHRPEPVPVHHHPVPMPAPVHHHSPIRECSPRPCLKPAPMHISPHHSPCRSPHRAPMHHHHEKSPILERREAFIASLHNSHRPEPLPVHHHPIPMHHHSPRHEPLPVHHHSPHHSPLREHSPICQRRASASPIRTAPCH